ncbi:MAG TPA: hypothetical protein VLX92_18960 [Kofleriaceae bacterium]|nr:hypothetical protein [Kofleriaceae bacterium]
MKSGLVVIALAGCASGTTPFGASDASPPGADAPAIDARPPADAARPIDARPIDAPPPPIDAARLADAPPDACVPVMTQLLANPAFDLAPVGTGWTQVPIDPQYPLVTNGGIPVQSAPYYAWLGGLTGEDEDQDTVTDQLYQDVAVPAGTTDLVITGFRAVGTDETTTTTVYDTGSLDLTRTDGSPIENVLALSNLTATGGTFVAFSHTFTADVAGQTVRLRMTTTNDIINVTSFWFDTLVLTATHCP